MDYFKKLPGFIRTPSGQEWVLFKKIPHIFFIGTAILVAAILYLYYLSAMPKPEQQKLIYLCFGLIFTHWFFVGTVAIGCIVVMIMKGPAYVADPYELPKENKSLERLDS
jgi:hypothetical protein